ncbi:MAG: hypothetical protein AAFR65_11135 [Pseudomonadota bacterium]
MATTELLFSFETKHQHARYSYQVHTRPEIEWIREGLKQDGKTQAGLAEALGVKAPRVSELLGYKRQLQISEIKPTEAYLGVPFPWKETYSDGNKDQFDGLGGLPLRRVAFALAHGVAYVIEAARHTNEIGSLESPPEKIEDLAPFWDGMAEEFLVALELSNEADADAIQAYYKVTKRRQSKAK